MEKYLNRRDFLKLASLCSLGFAIPPLKLEQVSLQSNTDRPNILILVYDAFSFHNTTLYGYPRRTTPNMDRLAERAIVYHNHISNANFTTPGTASLLTGAYPWSHRAFTLGETVQETFLTKNIFHGFPDYHRLAYTHNPLVNVLLAQFAQNIENLILPEEFYLSTGRSIDTLLKSDEDVAYVSWVRAFENKEEGTSYSLFLSHLNEYLKESSSQRVLDQYSADYPLGIPKVHGKYFLLEQATDYLKKLLTSSPTPFLGYVHLYPPHAPYLTRKDYFKAFSNDGYKPVEKPEHILTKDKSAKTMLYKRKEYDEYLLYVDAEFNRLYEYLEQSGLLDNTWLILTSDHGEMFERGFVGHGDPAMNQPVIHMPLLIFEPGRTSRQDIHATTSAVDILPTILQLAGQEVPEWCEGFILPPFNTKNTDSHPNLLSMEIRSNRKKGPVEKGSLVMINEPYKLIYYFNYKELGPVGGELIEFFDIYEDPEELDNLYTPDNALANAMLEELKTKLDEANRPYR